MEIFDKYDKTFDKYDKKFDKYDKKIDKYDKKFAEYDKQIEKNSLASSANNRNAGILKNATEAISDLVKSVSQKTSVIDTKQKQNILLITLTGLLVIRVMGLQNHVMKLDHKNPLWIASLSVLSLQSTINFVMWLFVMNKAREQTFTTLYELKPVLIKVSIFLTLLSVVHNGLSIANDVVSGIHESNMYTFSVSILLALVNATFFVVALKTMRHGTDRNGDSDTSVRISNVAEALRALNVPPVVA